MKSVTCKRCGEPDLMWAMSKNGKWYLSAPDTVGGKRGGHLTINFAHKCVTTQTNQEA